MVLNRMQNAENVGLRLIHSVILSSPLCFQTCMAYFLLWDTKEDILLTLLYVQNALNFSNYLFFYVPQKKEIHTGLE